MNESLDDSLDSTELEYTPFHLSVSHWLGVYGQRPSKKEKLMRDDGADALLRYEKMNDLRICQKYCDLTIQVEDKTFFCHKVILASSSSYFDTLIGGDFREANQDGISLNTMSAKTFEYILTFMYAQKIRINCKNVTGLLVASDFLGINFIERSAAEFIGNNYKKLPIEQILYLLQFAFNTGKYKFTDLLSRHLMCEISTVSQSSSFVEISYVALKSILQWVHECDIGFESNGENIVKAILLWVNYKPDDRNAELPEIIEMIEFGYSDPPYLEPLKKYAADADNNISQIVSDSRLISSDLQTVKRPSLYVFSHFFDDEITLALNQKLEWKSYCRKGTMKDTERRANNKIKTVRYERKKQVVCGRNLFHFYIGMPGRSKFLCSNLTNIHKLTRLEKPPIRRQGTLVSVQDRVYVYHNRDNPSNRGIGIYLYQSERDTWLDVPAPTTMEEGHLVSCNNVLYAVGAPNKIRPVTGFSRFDERIPRWESLPSVCYMNYQPAACACDEKVYVCSELTNEAAVFDPVANKWREIAPNKKDNKVDYYHFGLNMTSYNNKVWMLDGFSNIETYDPKIDEWSSFTSPLSAVDEKWKHARYTAFGILNIDP